MSILMETPTCNNCHRKSNKKPEGCKVRKVRNILATCPRYQHDRGMYGLAILNPIQRKALSVLRGSLPRMQKRQVRR